MIKEYKNNVNVTMDIHEKFRNEYNLRVLTIYVVRVFKIKYLGFHPKILMNLLFIIQDQINVIFLQKKKRFLQKKKMLKKLQKYYVLLIILLVKIIYHNLILKIY